MARIAHGFGLTVIACDPLLTAEEIRARGAEPVDFDTLLTRADILSLHCPLDDATRGLMDAWAFARMKPGALFLSTARGGIHDEDALLAALDSGHLAGAGWTCGASSRPRRRRGCCSIPTWPAPSIPAASRMKAAARWRRAARQISQMLAGIRPSACSIPTYGPGSWNGWRKRARTDSESARAGGGRL